jgi:Tol biopolymer transport system component
MVRSGDRAAIGALVGLVLAVVACTSRSSTTSAASTTDPATTASPTPKALYAVDIRTREATLFLEPPEGGSEFAIASGADRIAFERRDGNGDPQIFVVDADGTDLRQVTHGRGAQSPAWSPDGARIAYRGLAPDSTYEIYVVHVASGEAIRVTRQLPDVDSAYLDPVSWSPDGREIVFQVGEPPVVRSVDIGNGKTTTIVKDAGIPDVSPDGSLVAFNTWSVAKVTLADIDGSDRRMLRSDNDECCAKWSPNGERIAFVDLSGRVYVYTLTTGERRVVGVSSGDLVDWLDDQTLLVLV